MKAISNAYILGILVTLCLLMIDSSAYSGFRTRPRTTRGFKNAALSTARGFGKRDGGYIENSDAVMEFPFDFGNAINGGAFKTHQFTEKFPIDWLVDEFSKNPRLAKVIIRKFIDKNQDKKLSSDEILRNVEY